MISWKAIKPHKYSFIWSLYLMAITLICTHTHFLPLTSRITQWKIRFLQSDCHWLSVLTPSLVQIVPCSWEPSCFCFLVLALVYAWQTSPSRFPLQLSSHVKNYAPLLYFLLHTHTNRLPQTSSTYDESPLVFERSPQLFPRPPTWWKCWINERVWEKQFPFLCLFSLQ